MARQPFRRLFRWRVIRLVLAFALLTFIFDTLRHSRPPKYNIPSGDTKLKNEKVFIASTHWMNERILRSHWSAAVVKLCKDLGPENVYVSVYESGSWDGSKPALSELKKRLEASGVAHTVVLDGTTHADEIGRTPAKEGWIDTPRGKKELRRIPYLAKLRNESLKPMIKLVEQGVTYDKVLFLNDVVFTTNDVLNLFATNGGSYAAACSLDFQHAPNYYDTFALRDYDGLKAITQAFPYFGPSKSRQALLRNKAIPVQSCWNGIAVFDAAPFYNANKPLRFRGIPDSLAKYHLEGSECCLIHYDNPLSAKKGVFVNPTVRVAYNGPAYDAVHASDPWPIGWARIWGIWRNKFVGFTQTGRSSLESITVKNRVKEWQEERAANIEPGVACLINEMQVLVWNGWAHV